MVPPPVYIGFAVFCVVLNIVNGLLIATITHRWNC